MIEKPNCYKRKCKHFLGVKLNGKDEITERNYCLAFPNRIPDEVAYGNDLHLKSLPNQKNNITYEKEK